VILAALLTLAQAPPLEFVQREDRIALIGNTTAERMALFGHFEAGLHGALPDHDLRVFNLAWSADTVSERPRPYRFGELADDLGRLGIDLALLFFGFNESFDGPEGLADFDEGLRGLASQLSGEFGLRLILVTPLPAEDLGPHLPAASDRNELLRLYSNTVRRVGSDLGHPVLDLFARTSDLREAPAHRPLTFNGVHLTEFGDWFVARLLLEALGHDDPGWSLSVDAAGQARGIRCAAVRTQQAHGYELALDRLPAPAAPGGRGGSLEARGSVRIELEPGTWELLVDGEVGPRATHEEWRSGVPVFRTPSTRLRELVVERADHFFHRWRPVNGEYVYGRRASPFGVVSFPPEMERLDALIAEADERIRAELQRGRTVRLEWRAVP